MTVDLTEFLLARIAEDETAAGAALDEPGYPQFGDTAFEALLGLAESEGGDGTAIAHAGRWSPARVLAECEAKRRMVEAHPVYRGPRLVAVHSGRTPEYACETCHVTSNIDSESVIEALGPCDTLLALASVYSDHPDFREEWRA